MIDAKLLKNQFLPYIMHQGGFADFRGFWNQNVRFIRLVLHLYPIYNDFLCFFLPVTSQMQTRFNVFTVYKKNCLFQVELFYTFLHKCCINLSISRNQGRQENRVLHPISSDIFWRFQLGWGWRTEGCWQHSRQDDTVSLYDPCGNLWPWGQFRGSVWNWCYGRRETSIGESKWKTRFLNNYRLLLFSFWGKCFKIIATKIFLIINLYIYI